MTKLSPFWLPFPSRRCGTFKYSNLIRMHDVVRYELMTGKSAVSPFTICPSMNAVSSKERGIAAMKLSRTQIVIGRLKTQWTSAMPTGEFTRPMVPVNLSTTRVQENRQVWRSSCLLLLGKNVNLCGIEFPRGLLAQPYSLVTLKT